MLVIALTLLCIVSCTVGPSYVKPNPDIPVTWELSEKEAATIINPLWWEQFGDPELNRLVHLALNENRDIRRAVAAVDEFMAHLGVAKSDRYPQISASASASRSKTSQDGNPPFPDDPYSSIYAVTFNTSYEVDLWGRIRRSVEASRAALFSHEEVRRGIMLTVVSQTATAYIQLLELDKRLSIARNTLALREDAYKLAKIRFHGGLTSELDVHQSAVELTTAQTLIPQLEQLIRLQEHQISVLTGRNPSVVKRGKTFDELTAPRIPSALPSDLLKRRPDIIQAEQDLIAANARIGQAMADYFPQISLTAMLGVQTGEQMGVYLPFSWKSNLINAGLSATAPIFTGFRTNRLVKAAESREQQTRIIYEQKVITAFREVYDALVSRISLDRQVEAQARQIEALRSLLKVAQLRYMNGYSSFIDVLDAQRNLLNSELSIVQTRSSGYQSIIELYRALGGGWDKTWISTSQ
jgi:multidrug efflux system outer membrane protein